MSIDFIWKDFGGMNHSQYRQYNKENGINTRLKTILSLSDHKIM